MPCDSHVHSYIRSKWALTEDNPTIKAYEEGDWVLLDDCRQGDLEPSLALLDGLHAKWVQVLESKRTIYLGQLFIHPDIQNHGIGSAVVQELIGRARREAVLRMKESAFAAVTYARSRARWLGLSEQFHRELDIHIHIPEGATPKDGPSAGITIAVALISALTNTPTRADLAMTGEITLRGRVLVVGGIKEKAVAALRRGIRRVLLPGANVVDIERLPDEVRAGVKLVLVDTMDQVLREALLPRRGARDRTGAAAQGAHGLGGQVT